MASDPLNSSSGTSSVLSQYIPNVLQNSQAPSNTSQPSSSAPVAYQPVTGDSLDQMMRSLQNLISGQGYSTTQSGQNLLSSGLSLQSMPIEFWQGLLSGSPESSSFIQQAISPYVTAINNQFAGANSNAGSNLPAGGYRSSYMASFPQAQAQQVSNIYSQFAQLIPTAAEQLSSLGLSSSQLGLSQSSQGQNELLQALNALLGEKGIDVNQQTSNLSNLTSGLESIFSALV